MTRRDVLLQALSFLCSRLSVAGRSTCYQIPAYFADGFSRGFSTKGRRRLAKFAAENVRKMTVAGKAKLKSQYGQVDVGFGKPFKRCPKAKQSQVPMYREPRLPAKHACEIERRCSDFTRNFIKRYALGHASSQKLFSVFGFFRVVNVSCDPARFWRRTVLVKGKFQDIATSWSVVSSAQKCSIGSSHRLSSRCRSRR